MHVSSQSLSRLVLVLGNYVLARASVLGQSFRVLAGSLHLVMLVCSTKERAGVR